MPKKFGNQNLNSEVSKMASQKKIEYSVIDVFKIYFDFLIRMVEGDTETVLFLQFNIYLKFSFNSKSS